MDWIQRLFSGWEIAAVGSSCHRRFLSAGTACRASLSTWRPRDVRCAIYHGCKNRPRRNRSSVRAHRRSRPKHLAAHHLCLPLPVPAHLAAPFMCPREPALESTSRCARAPFYSLVARAAPSHWSLSSNAAPPSPIQAASTPVRARCATASAPPRPRPVPPNVSYRVPVPSARLTPAPRCPPRAAGFNVTKPPYH
jgi:hypothetical protein